MLDDRYHKDHWVEIEPDRPNRYEAQLAWGVGGTRLIKPADIQTRYQVADYGGGPGKMLWLRHALNMS